MKNRNLFLLTPIIFSLSTCIVEAQKPADVEASGLKDSTKSINLNYEDYTWNKSYDFYRELIKIEKPSTISGVYADYKFHFSGINKKPYLLNADIKTPIALGGKKWNNFSVHIIPQFKVRIFRDDDTFNVDSLPGDVSKPVRTPSYLPRVTLYKTWDNCWNIGNEQSSKYIGFSAFHHSNGQDGQEILNNGAINVYNGNFGEQLVFDFLFGRIKTNAKPDNYSLFNSSKKFSNPASYENFKRIKLLRQRDSYQVTKYQKYWFEAHWPYVLTNKEFDELNLYGRYRLNAEFGWLISSHVKEKIVIPEKKAIYGILETEAEDMGRREDFRIILDASYIIDDKYNIGDGSDNRAIGLLHPRRLNLTATGYWVIPQTYMSALFIQCAYIGSDNYNVYFQDSYFMFRFGLALANFNWNK